MADNDARAETELHQQRLGRITFRAWRRGFREADLVLGPFMEREGATLSDIELDQLEEVLTDAWLCRAPKRLAAEFLKSSGMQA